MLDFVIVYGEITQNVLHELRFDRGKMGTGGCQIWGWVTGVVTRVVTIRYPHDAIRIAILGSRYDTYRDTC